MVVVVGLALVCWGREECGHRRMQTGPQVQLHPSYCGMQSIHLLCSLDAMIHRCTPSWRVDAVDLARYSRANAHDDAQAPTAAEVRVRRCELPLAAGGYCLYCQVEVSELCE